MACWMAWILSSPIQDGSAREEAIIVNFTSLTQKPKMEISKKKKKKKKKERERETLPLV